MISHGREEERSNLMLSKSCPKSKEVEEPYHLGSDSLLLLINRSTHLASLFNYMFMAYLIFIKCIVN